MPSPSRAACQSWRIRLAGRGAGCGHSPSPRPAKRSWLCGQCSKCGDMAAYWNTQRQAHYGKKCSCLLARKETNGAGSPYLSTSFGGATVQGSGLGCIYLGWSPAASRLTRYGWMQSRIQSAQVCAAGGPISARSQPYLLRKGSALRRRSRSILFLSRKKHDAGLFEIWRFNGEEERHYYRSVESWRRGIDQEEAEQADAHSCRGNAEYTDSGPAGAGTYCTVCGALVRSYEY